MLQKIIIVKIVFGTLLFLAILLTGCENSIIPRVDEVNETLKNSARAIFLPEDDSNNNINPTYKAY